MNVTEVRNSDFKKAFSQNFQFHRRDPRSDWWGDLNFKLQKFMLVGNVYQKTVPENQLEVNLENECEFFYTIVPKSLFQIEDFEF